MLSPLVFINNLSLVCMFVLRFSENLQVARLDAGIGQEQRDVRDYDVHLGGNARHRRQGQ